MTGQESPRTIKARSRVEPQPSQIGRVAGAHFTICQLPHKRPKLSMENASEPTTTVSLPTDIWILIQNEYIGWAAAERNYIPTYFMK